MENRKEFYFPSSDGATQIHAIEWGGVENPVGILQIAHGISEYALRYEPFARFLNERGFIVVAGDHIGHGQSIAPNAAPLYLGAYDGWQHAVDDMHTLHTLTVKQYPELPYFLLGHSMGSFLARTYLIRYPGTLKGAIIMGTGQQSPLLVMGGKAFAKVEGSRIGPDKFSPAVDKLAFGAYNKPFAPNRTPFDWLSVNEENVDAYIADPLCGGGASIGLFYDMLCGIEFISKQSNVDKMDKDTPILFISGANDPVGDMGKGVQKAHESFRKAGVRDLSLKLYDGLRHEILNEKCRETVYTDLWAWIEQHL